MKLTIDVENTITKRDDKKHLDPFEPTNRLVLVGAKKEDNTYYIFDEKNNFCGLQELLDQATILIGHNIAYDLVWLWECGFKYDGPVFDTMLAEYVLQRGIKEPLSLEACAERNKLDTKKQDTLKEYFKKGLNVDEIPRVELIEYLQADLRATQELSQKQILKLNTEEYSSLMRTVELTNRVAFILAKIYQTGFSVDLSKLEEVKKEFVNEKKTIENKLKVMVKELMGDMPINLNSPEQLSWIIYSRKPKDKTMWTHCFDRYMAKDLFNRTIKDNSNIVYKTKAVHCEFCKGYGKEYKVRKDGVPYAKQPTCKKCDGLGYLQISTNEIAGLKLSPPSSKWVSANGFSVNKVYLEILKENVKHNKSAKHIHDFLSNIERLSALDTYLSSFVEGISSYVKSDNKLHVRLLQHRTATGRFSGADPNMQNMPRGGTFPVKKVFVSRFKGGKILEADFAQLEFRTAAYLSQDKVAMNEIKNNFDVHSYTANIITGAGQKTSRQDAKAHTFAPLYGATGFGRSKAEAEYYTHFTQKYKGIGVWHTRLAKEAITEKRITTESGRQFSFPDVRRFPSGKVSNATQIKNYPVQSFATADIVPLILTKIYERLENMKSCIVNTVHDSIVIDIHPEEEKQILYIIKDINNNMTNIINTFYNIDFNIPLLLESKIGSNWLDTKEIM